MSDPNERTLNVDLLEQVLERIVDEDRRGTGNWNQGDWVRPEKSAECGTTMCFAGWALHLSGYEMVVDRGFGIAYFKGDDGDQVVVEAEAAGLLGLNDYEAGQLFFGPTDIDVLGETVADIVNGDYR